MNSVLCSVPGLWHSFNPFIRVFVLISLAAAIGIMVMMINLYVLKSLRNIRHRRRVLLSSFMRDKVFSKIASRVDAEGNFHPALLSMDYRGLKKFNLKDRKTRNVIVNEMIAFKDSFPELFTDMIRDMYVALDLHLYAVADLHRKKWQLQVEALLELQHIGLLLDEKEIFPLLNHTNKYVREMARCYIVKLSDNPISCLSYITEPLSKWEEIELFRLISLHEHVDLHLMHDYINKHTEPTIAKLSLKLAVYYRFKEVFTDILDLIHTDNAELLSETIHAIGKLQIDTAEPMLVGLYPAQSKDIKLQILDALGSMDSGRQLSFLAEVFLSSSDFEEKKHASQAIVKQKQTAALFINGLLRELTGENLQIFRHTLHPLTTNS